MMTSLEARIANILNDSSHGSSILLHNIIDILLKEDFTQKELLYVFSELEKIDFSMVIIHHFLKSIKPAIKNNFKKKILNYQNTWSNINHKIAKQLIHYLSDKSFTILTHSHSGVVIEIIKHLTRDGYSINVIQTQSQPGGEGVLQADELRQFGLEVFLIKDHEVNTIINNTDYCFMGVDQYDDTSFINKIGSKNIIESAENHHKPVYLLGDSRKKLENILVTENSLFEEVGLTKNTILITEKNKV
jgi:translation initiation factor 2B subunit (eIF-2B alpha/beta/delta family)